MLRMLAAPQGGLLRLGTAGREPPRCACFACLLPPRGAAPPWDGPAAERRILAKGVQHAHTARHCVCARPSARAVGLARAPQCLWYCLHLGQEPEEHRPPQRSGYPLCMSWLRRGPGGAGSRSKNQPSEQSTSSPRQRTSNFAPEIPKPPIYRRKKTRPESLVFLGTDADQLLTRLRYSFVRVSISILSPMAQNSGTFSS